MLSLLLLLLMGALPMSWIMRRVLALMQGGEGGAITRGFLGEGNLL